MKAYRILYGVVAAAALALQSPAYAQSGEAIAALIEQGKAAEAEALARQALAAAEAASGRQSAEAAEAQLTLAYALFAQEKWDVSIAAMERRAVIYEAIAGADSEQAVSAVSDLTSALIAVADRAEEAADWTLAEASLERIVTLYARFREPADRDAIGYRRRLASAIKSQGRPVDAEPILRQTLDLAESTYGSGDQLTLDLINDLGRTLEAQYKHDLASELYAEALEAGRAAFGPDDPGVLVYAQNMGASLMYQQQFDAALPVIKDTLERRTRVLGPDAAHTLFSMSDMATVLTFKGDTAAAGAIWEDLVPRSERVFGPEHPYTAQIRNGYALYLDRAGNDPAKALQEAQLAADLVRARRDVVGLDPRGQRTLATFTEEDAFYFELWLHTLRQAGQQEGLPQINRIVLFYEAIGAIQEAMESPANMAVIRRAAERAAEVEGPELAALAKERQELSQQWQSLAATRSTLMSQIADSTQLAQIEGEQGRLETAIKAIDAQFLGKFPQFFNLLRPRPVDAPDLQQMLKGRDEAVLIVLPTALGTHVMAISGSDMDWHVSDLPARTIDEVVRRLRWDLGASVEATPDEKAEWIAEGQGQGPYPFDRRLAWALYNQVVAPVEWVLEGKRHVFVVAGGSLSALPFSVLVTDEPQGLDGDPSALRATGWLADKYALAQLPSVQSLALLRQFGGDAGEADGFLGFGDPTLTGVAQTRGGGQDVRGGTRDGGAIRAIGFNQAYDAVSGADGLPKVNIEALRGMARLPGTGTELEAMRKVLGAPASAVLTGDRATETAVKSADLSKAAIVTFATHGLLAGEIDGTSEPGLVFTPPKSGSPSDDGLLTMTEIAMLRMNARWVILSACNTAAGDGSAGASGLSGLAKSFFLAGAQSLLASHWPVRDAVAAELTVGAISAQRDNPALSRAEALQKAMRDIRNDASHDTDKDTWAHPNAWAPFTLVGDVE